MNQNKFSVPTTYWDKLDDHAKELFNQVYDEVRKEQPKLMNGLPSEQRKMFEQNTQGTESFLKLIVLETVRATQLHTTT